MIAAVETIIITASWAHFITALLVPIAVGLVTKLRAASKIKVAVTLVITGIATLITKNVNEAGDAVLSVPTLVSFVEIYVLQLAAFFGFVKPLEIREKVLAPEAGIS